MKYSVRNLMEMSVKIIGVVILWATKELIRLLKIDNNVGNIYINISEVIIN